MVTIHLFNLGAIPRGRSALGSSFRWHIKTLFQQIRPRHDHFDHVLHCRVNKYEGYLTVQLFYPQHRATPPPPPRDNCLERLHLRGLITLYFILCAVMLHLHPRDRCQKDMFVKKSRLLLFLMDFWSNYWLWFFKWFLTVTPKLACWLNEWKRKSNGVCVWKWAETERNSRIIEKNLVPTRLDS